MHFACEAMGVIKIIKEKGDEKRAWHLRDKQYHWHLQRDREGAARATG